MRLTRWQLRQIIKENLQAGQEEELKTAIDNFIAAIAQPYKDAGQDLQDSKVRRKIFKELYVIVESQFKASLGEQ